MWLTCETTSAAPSMGCWDWATQPLQRHAGAPGWHRGRAPTLASWQPTSLVVTPRLTFFFFDKPPYPSIPDFHSHGPKPGESGIHGTRHALTPPEPLSAACLACVTFHPTGLGGPAHAPGIARCRLRVGTCGGPRARARNRTWLTSPAQCQHPNHGNTIHGKNQCSATQSTKHKHNSTKTKRLE